MSSHASGSWVPGSASALTPHVHLMFSGDRPLRSLHGYCKSSITARFGDSVLAVSVQGATPPGPRKTQTAPELGCRSTPNVPYHLTAPRRVEQDRAQIPAPDPHPPASTIDSSCCRELCRELMQPQARTKIHGEDNVGTCILSNAYLPSAYVSSTAAISKHDSTLPNTRISRVIILPAI